MYQIISDGSCDLDPKVAEAIHVHVVPFYVSFQQGEYLKEGKDIGVREFYQRLVDEPKVFPFSSMPSTDDYIQAFRKYVDQGLDIICLCITTKFSGSYNSAMTAKQMMEEQGCKQKIAVIDTQINTVLQGLLVQEVARMRDAGLSFEEVLAAIDRIKPTGRIIFTVGGLDHLVHGGRIGKVMGAAVSTLRIKPLIILKEGEIFSAGICRNRANSLKRLPELTKKHFDEIGESPDDYRFCVGYGYDIEEAKQFQAALLASLQSYSKQDQAPLEQIGATIAVHTGPYPLGLGLIRKFDA